MKRLLILLLTSVIGLAACASYTSPPTIEDSRIAPKNATSWVLIDWKTPDGVRAFIPEKGKKPITLQFYAIESDKRATEGKVSGFAGCNHIQGTYTETADTITIGTLASTKQVCEPLIMRMETAFVQRVSNISLQKSFSRNGRGSLLLLTSKYGDKWTFVEMGSIRSIEQPIEKDI